MKRAAFILLLTTSVMCSALWANASQEKEYFIFKSSYTRGRIVNALRQATVIRAGHRWDVIRTARDLRGWGVYPVHPLRPLLDVAAEVVGVKPPHGKMPPGCTGVLIGIVDTGIDLYNPDFVYSDGTNVFAYVWDQTSLTGPPPEGYSYGHECTTGDINQGECFVEDDGTSHGTHVAGILASLNSVYTGLCPDAMFVFVKVKFVETAVVDAVCYIAEKARSLNMPFVVNLSLGGQYGPHDGTTPFEDLIAECLGEDGLAVAAAGNDGNHFVHCGTSSTGPRACRLVPVSFFFPGGGSVEVELWANPPLVSRYAVGLMKDGSLIDISSWVKSGTIAVSSFTSDKGDFALSVTIDALDSPSAMNGADHVLFQIQGPEFDAYEYVILMEPQSQEVRWDMWISEGSAYFSTVTDTITVATSTVKLIPGDTFYTINVPATSPRIIATGSFVSRNSWYDKNGQLRSIGKTIGSLSTFSSKGPARGEGFVKPDVVAPGEVVVSSHADDSMVSSGYITEDGEHMVLWGTSVASPFVTGVAARLLDPCNGLSPQEVRELIWNSAVTDVFTGQVPNPSWGYGKLHFPLDILSSRGNIGECDDEPPGLILLNMKPQGNGKVEVEWMMDKPGRVRIMWEGSGMAGEFFQSTVSDAGKSVFSPGVGRVEVTLTIESLRGVSAVYGPYVFVNNIMRGFGCRFSPEGDLPGTLLLLLLVFQVMWVLAYTRREN